MITILIYVFASHGLAYIVGRSEISFRVRVVIGRYSDWLLALIECPACFGTYSGFLAGCVLNPLALPYHWIWNAIVTALFTAGSNIVLARASGFFVPGAAPFNDSPPSSQETP